MHTLLQDYSGAVELVVDNAALTMERLAPRRSTFHTLGSSSSHSCNRWETEETSPTSTTEKDAKGPGVAKPSFRCRSLTLQSKNSSPACPIRKLSPRVYTDNQIQDNIKSPSSRHQMELKSPLRVYDRIAFARPPRSPRKNNGRSLLPPGGSMTHAPSKYSEKIGLQPPVRLLSKPICLADSTPLNIGHDVPPPIDGLIRGLSQTLGTDVKEQAPICPTRRPSTQSSDHVSTAYENNSFSHSVTVQYHCDGRDILVLPPQPETETPFVEKPSFDDDHLHYQDWSQDSHLSEGEGCSSVLLQRFSKRQ